MDEDFIPVESLRKPSVGQRQDLQASIDNLNQSINSLIGLFKEAAGSLKAEEMEANLISKKIDPIFQKLDEISEQNKKIARGIVAIADMIEEKMGSRRAMPSNERPAPMMQGPPSMGPSMMAPPPMGMRPTSLPPRPPVPPAPPR